jgi:hypothetical protein
MMRLLSDTWFVAQRELVKFFRGKVRVIITLIQPVVWLGSWGT